MKHLKQILHPRESVFNKSRRDVVLDLLDLTQGNIDPEDFFAENFITEGMKQLYEAVYRRLEGTADDGIFKLTQAMGGGKTHNMIAMGLLAQFPEYRKTMDVVYKTKFKAKAKVISFTGRTQPVHGIWGFLAKQLGKEELFKQFFSAGLKAPGQGDWIGLLQGEPTLIMLDELPPYFQNASTVSVGAGTLADVTTTALSNLLVAVGKKELSNVALVISDLSASYTRGSDQLAQVFSDFENETKRLSKNFTPVRQNSDEIYRILRKRLFANEVDDKVITEVADAYSTELDRAYRMDLTNDSPQKLNTAIKESYPFHPSIRELYARFKENPGFQQTRGLIRLMRTVVSSMYDKKTGWADKTSLIHPFDIDPNDPDTMNELNQINSALTNAISHDIASNGQSSAEKFAEELANDLPIKTARLILMSSLSNVQGSTKGLKNTELASFLAIPGANVSTLNASIIPELRSRSWYLHADNAGNLLFKDVQNVSAMVNSFRQTYNQEAIRKEIIKMLEKLFAPSLKDCYQRIAVLPAIDEIEIDKANVTLIIYQPHQSGKLHPDLDRLYNAERLKNRMLFLTGDHQSMESIYDQARGIKATEAVIASFEKEKVPKNDPQFEEANTLLENYQFKFYSAVQNIFTKLYYPTKRDLMEAAIQLKFDSNNYNGEEQIIKTLLEKRKFTNEITSETFVKKIEAKLFNNQREIPWADLLQNAGMLADWDWHKPGALEQVRDSQILKDLWRMNGNYIDKGPFEKPATRVDVQFVTRDETTGSVKLKVKPVNGDLVYYDYGQNVSESCPKLDLTQVMETGEMEVQFLCVDSKKEHKTGDPSLWTNEITLKHEFIPQGGETLLEVRVAPPNAEIRYSTDGSDPFTNGGVYAGPFKVKPKEIIQVIGVKGNYKSEPSMLRAPEKSGQLEIDRAKQLKWKRKCQFGSTSESYQAIGLLKKHLAKLKGIEISMRDDRDRYVALSADPNSKYDADRVEEYLKFLQERFDIKGELSLEFTALLFESGQRFLDYVKEMTLDYKPGEIEQRD
jgi:uncharacterized protein DUF499/chitobiase/beta-hexosaminidase-like protein